MAYCGLRTAEVHRANMGNLKTQARPVLRQVHGKGRREADEVVVVLPARNTSSARGRPAASTNRALAQHTSTFTTPQTSAGTR